jgi:transposase
MDDEVVIESVLPSARTRAPKVLLGPERRRRWSTEEKLRILAHSIAPGSSASLTCRIHGISSGQLYTWRKQFRLGALTGFVPVSIAPEPSRLPAAEPPVTSTEPATTGVIEVALPTGVNLRVSGNVSEVSLRRVLAALS